MLKNERLEGRARVLLVEDERAVAELTRRTLEFGGYTVLVANSGNEALSILDELTEPIDLLLTDVVMPDMRIMFVSGYPGPLDEEFTHARLRAKPFSPADLLRQVGEALRA